MPWAVSAAGCLLSVLPWLYTMGSAFAYSTTMETGCTHNENLAHVCDEELWAKVRAGQCRLCLCWARLVALLTPTHSCCPSRCCHTAHTHRAQVVLMVFVKLPICCKVVYYPVYDIDPKRLRVAIDGAWKTARPLVSRVAMALTMAAGGMASVPFVYLIRLQVGVALIGLLAVGFVVTAALTSVVEFCRGAIKLHAAMGRVYASGVAAAVIGSIIAYVRRGTQPPRVPALTPRLRAPLCMRVQVGICPGEWVPVRAIQSRRRRQWRLRGRLVPGGGGTGSCAACDHLLLAPRRHHRTPRPQP